MAGKGKGGPSPPTQTLKAGELWGSLHFPAAAVLFVNSLGEADRLAHRLGEKEAPCREPNVGLDPGSPGLHPGLKVALDR